jgi:hypothetical protein
MSQTDAWDALPSDSFLADLSYVLLSFVQVRYPIMLTALRALLVPCDVCAMFAAINNSQDDQRVLPRNLRLK